jgi:putative ABC transport system substrate-binding protein
MKSVHATPIRGVLAALAIGTLLLSGCSSDDSGGSPADDEERPLRVGVLQLSEATLLDDIVKGFQDGIREELKPREVTFDVKNSQGDNSLIQSIAGQLKDSDADLFAVAGTPGIIALSQVETRRPIIGLAMTDPIKAKVAKSLDASETNVTGSLGFIEPAEILTELVGIKPAPRKIGTVYDPSNEASRIWVESFKEALRGLPELSLAEATIASSGDISAAARSLAGRTDTWVIPPDTTVIAGMPAVGAAALKAKTPLIITGGDSTVAGVLASIGPNYAELGALAATTAARVVRGEEPGKVPFVRPGGATWAVNDETRDALEVKLPTSAGG